MTHKQHPSQPPALTKVGAGKDMRVRARTWEDSSKTVVRIAPQFRSNSSSACAGSRATTSAVLLAHPPKKEDSSAKQPSSQPVAGFSRAACFCKAFCLASITASLSCAAVIMSPFLRQSRFRRSFSSCFPTMNQMWYKLSKACLG